MTFYCVISRLPLPSSGKSGAELLLRCGTMVTPHWGLAITAVLILILDPFVCFCSCLSNRLCCCFTVFIFIILNVLLFKIRYFLVRHKKTISISFLLILAMLFYKCWSDKKKADQLMVQHVDPNSRIAALYRQGNPS
ncbi:hypothetical protein HAT2_00150 [Candidatus Similichlamydia laticola]|uniref:Uncharacterized protein n=1 Tax=Candidatus Similichlamydia laticola TaxID=2170265 RepID=A0A369KE85_9BACT|nr:hypothetical protein HAT2_00150 [Candidatus Similichlamydia laticola]